MKKYNFTFLVFFIVIGALLSEVYAQECNYGMEISSEDINESCNRIQKAAIDTFNRSSETPRFDSLSYLGVKTYDQGCKWVLTFQLQFCIRIKDKGKESAQCVEERNSVYTITINLHADGSAGWHVDSTKGEDLITFFNELIGIYFSECTVCKTEKK